MECLLTKKIYYELPKTQERAIEINAITHRSTSPERNRQLERSRCRWDIIIIGLDKIMWEV